jgi:hypothetical protein
MSRITVQEAQGWAEGTKLTITTLDTNLLDHLEEEVIRQLASAFTVTAWIDATTTPKLVRTIISKLYIAWIYDKQYSEDVNVPSSYAARLKENANLLLAGLLAGTIELPGNLGVVTPSFYPTDASSALTPTFDDPSLGPAAFSMGMRF